MKPSTAIEDIVQACLRRIQAGEDVATCLRDYPEHVAVLAPILEVAARLRRIQPLELAGRVRTSARLQARAALAKQRASGSSHRLPRTLDRHTWRLLGTVILLMLLVGTFGVTVAAAQGSLPGDTLYSVKRGSEQVRVRLTPNAEGKARLYLSYADRRIGESLLLITQGRTPEPLSVVEIERTYLAARELIDQVPPADRAPLQERYAQTLRTHQRQLEDALERVGSPSARMLLEGALRMNASAGQLEIPTATPSVEPIPSPTATQPRPTMSPPRPTSTAGNVNGAMPTVRSGNEGGEPPAATPTESPAPAKIVVPSSTSVELPRPDSTKTSGPEPTHDSPTTPVVPQQPTSTKAPESQATEMVPPAPTSQPTLTQDLPPTDEPQPTREPEPTYTPESTDEPEPTQKVKSTDKPEPTRGKPD